MRVYREGLQAAARGWRMIFRRFTAPAALVPAASWRTLIGARRELRWRKEPTPLLARPTAYRPIVLPSVAACIRAEAELPLRPALRAIEDRPSAPFEATHGFHRLAAVAAAGGVVNAHVREQRRDASGLAARSLLVVALPAGRLRHADGRA